MLTHEPPLIRDFSLRCSIILPSRILHSPGHRARPPNHTAVRVSWRHRGGGSLPCAPSVANCARRQGSPLTSRNTVQGTSSPKRHPMLPDIHIFYPTKYEAVQVRPFGLLFLGKTAIRTPSLPDCSYVGREGVYYLCLDVLTTIIGNKS